MKKEVINGPGLAQPSAPVSLAVRAGGFVYTCGQMPTDPHTGEPVEGIIEDKARATRKHSTGARVSRRKAYRCCESNGLHNGSQHA